MKSIEQTFSVPFSYRVEFTENLFDRSNSIFSDIVKSGKDHTKPKILFVFDKGMYTHYPGLFENIRAYHSSHSGSFDLVDQPVVLPGGEASKNDPSHVQKIVDHIEKADLDRHSYVTVIGGGAVTDTAGYAAAIAHRGIRLVRVPTTVLAQNDAAVGVKNGVNAYGKKNFLGTFAPPHAVLNDFTFLKTLDDRQWRAGISEAIKVALIKDETFFDELEKNAGALRDRNMQAMQALIHRCAQLHMEHISTSGDPFERGSSRPLDFGHWAAHKLEQLTTYRLLHGEAVGIGIALDTLYSSLKGLITQEECRRVIELFKACGFQLFVPELENDLEHPEKPASILHGLQEFREHLGGELTIMLLHQIGKGIEVHEIDLPVYRQAIRQLKKTEQEPANSFNS